MLGMTIIICIFLFLMIILITKINKKIKELEKGFKLTLDIAKRQDERLEELENK